MAISDGLVLAVTEHSLGNFKKEGGEYSPARHNIYYEGLSPESLADNHIAAAI